MLGEDLHSAKILIVDDELANVRLLERQLAKWGYTNLQSTTDARQAVSIFTSLQPDIVLLDLMMPHVNGFQVMEQLRPFMSPEDYVPILILTADITRQARQNGLASGAKDFITKPFDATELSLRIHNLLETRFLYRHQKNQTVIAEEMVRLRTRELDESQVEILDRLAQAAEFRDDDTGQHTRRVGVLSALLAQSLGLDETTVEIIQRTAPLHDVGKIGVPDNILLKPGKLTPEEFDIIKGHTTTGAALLREGHSDLVHMAHSIALTHHERWNGMGYPQGLCGQDIPVEGRIVTIVDVFDALTHERPYKQAWPIEKATEEIQQQSGQQFDPAVVDAFLRVPNLHDFV